jgi:molybdopterin-guanine dinucleotide biosynthesis protein A
MSISVTIAILAGGQSRRMGTDKSFVNLRGKPLISHVLERVSILSLPTMLIANQQEPYRFLGLPIFGDIIIGKGSLGGLYTALFHSSTSHTLCVACDMPCLNPSLISYLIDQCQDYDAIVPRIDNLPQSFHAIYRKTCLPIVAKQVEQGHLKVRDLYPLLNSHFVDEEELRTVDPLLKSFINVNTPEALERTLGCV